MQIKLARCIINGVNEHRSHSDDIGRLSDARERIPEQGFAEPLAFFGLINSEACKQDQANWMICYAVRNSFRRFVFEHGPGGECVITEDSVLKVGDIGLYGFCALVGPCKTLQPVVELRVTAVELRKLMILRQLLNNEVGL